MDGQRTESLMNNRVCKVSKYFPTGQLIATGEIVTLKWRNLADITWLSKLTLLVMELAKEDTSPLWYICQKMCAMNLVAGKHQTSPSCRTFCQITRTV